jgi:GNAT superfamily N-acetyltransferase
MPAPEANSTGSALTVRRAGRNDLSAVLGVHARHHADGSLPAGASELERETWARMAAMPGLDVYLVELGGEAVGTASVMQFPNITYDCHPSAIIEAVVVAHPYRRQGIATAMLERMVEDLRSAGCNKVQLLSHKRHSGDGAHRLYTSLGFEPEAEGFRLYLGRVPEAVQQARRRSRPLGGSRAANAAGARSLTDEVDHGAAGLAQDDIRAVGNRPLGPEGNRIDKLEVGPVLGQAAPPIITWFP